MTRIGSLFSGCEGLGLGVKAAVGGDIAWHSEIEPAASKVLAHRFPGVPNLGDVTTVNWAAVLPVEILTAGFPCQPVSTAGRRAGITDERWLFDVGVLAALRGLRTQPRLLVLENVPGLLTANGGHAMARVVQGLASCGYVGRYGLFSAADIGAPHLRKRWFCVAWPAADAAHLGYERGGSARFGWPGPADSRGRVAADPYGVGVRQQSVAVSRRGGEAVAELPRADVAPDADHQGHEGTESTAGHLVPSRRIAADTDSDALGARLHRESVNGQTHDQQRRDDAAGLGVAVDWGSYGQAIRRWSSVLGRSAPGPTITGTRGQPKLNPAFVEFMMGLPAGWVTDVPGITVNEQLKMLGNGVVPQQAAAALSSLLGQRARVGAA